MSNIHYWNFICAKVFLLILKQLYKYQFYLNPMLKTCITATNWCCHTVIFCIYCRCMSISVDSWPFDMLCVNWAFQSISQFAFNLSQQTFYIGPTSAADIGPMSDVQLGYTSGRYRLPTCSRYCADIQRSSLFLAKTPFFIVKTQCK